MGGWLCRRAVEAGCGGWLCSWLCRPAVRQLLEEWFPLGGVILLSPRWRSAEDSFLFLLFKAFAVGSACRRVHVTLSRIWVSWRSVSLSFVSKIAASGVHLKKAVHPQVS